MIEHSFKNWDIADEFSIHQIPLNKFRPWFTNNRSKLFSETLDFNYREVLSELDKEMQKKLADRLSNMFTVALVLYHQNTIIGWAIGHQESAEKFYQTNSAILPEYRNRGLYRKLLKIMIEVVKGEGFQVIYSRHAMTNSAIIVPKLKSGFIMSGFELSDSFGALVHLTYFINPIRKKVMEFRAGDLRPDEDLKSLLKL